MQKNLGMQIVGMQKSPGRHVCMYNLPSLNDKKNLEFLQRKMDVSDASLYVDYQISELHGHCICYHKFCKHEHRVSRFYGSYKE